MQTISGYYHYEILAVHRRVLFHHVAADSHGVRCSPCSCRRWCRTNSSGTASSSACSSLQTILFAFGWENTLYLPGAVAALHLFRHERLRAFRALDRLVHYLLVRDIRAAGSHLHGAGAPRCRGLAARPRPPCEGAHVRASRRRRRCCCCSPSARAAGISTTRMCSMNSSRRPTSVIGSPTMRGNSKSTSISCSRRSRPWIRSSTFFPKAAPSPEPADSPCRTRAPSRSRKFT